MNSDVISKSILNEIEDVVYISDPKTYELYYMNGMLKKTLGNPTEEQWRRRKCYKVLQGREEPCPFCTNHLLTQNKFYNWEHYNALLDQYYFIQDKMVSFEGIQARLEIAKNITAQKLLEQDLTRRLEQQQILNSCIALLHTTDSPFQSIQKLLGLVASYHNAERGYIFLLSEDNTLVSNSHEWCAIGVTPQIDALQNIDATIVSRWFEKYREVGEFYIDSIGEELDTNSEEYEILAMQEITSLVTAPLYSTDQSFMGFLGVDNPKNNIKETSVIRAISSFVADFLDKNKQIEKLYQVSYFDNLTGLRNRHSYSLKIVELEKAPPETLGVLYVDINGLKAINDKFGHQKGDAYISELSTVLSDLYGECAFRIGGDEFVMICDGKEETDYEEKWKKLLEFIHKDGFPSAAVGCSWRGTHCDILEQIEQADHMMYKSKEEQYTKYGETSDLFRYKYRLENSNKNSSQGEA